LRLAIAIRPPELFQTCSQYRASLSVEQ